MPNTGSKESLYGLIQAILSPCTKEERILPLTRNLCRRAGLLMGHQRRIQGEQAELERRQRISSRKAARRKVNKTMLNRSRATKYEREW